MKKFYGLLLSLCVSMPASASLISIDYKWLAPDSIDEFPWYVPSPSFMNIVVDGTVANSADPLTTGAGDMKFANLIRGGSVNIAGRDFAFEVDSPNQLLFDRHWSGNWDRLEFTASAMDSTGFKKYFWLAVELYKVSADEAADLQVLKFSGPNESYGTFGKTSFDAYKYKASEVPEPGSIALTLFGLVSLVVVRLFKTCK